MEEEHVEYEHQTTSLRYSAEEAVQDTGCHKRLESGCSSAPRSSGRRKNEKVEEYWQSTCPGGQDHSNNTSSSKHEHIADL
jgi:hypothetical protein